MIDKIITVLVCMGTTFLAGYGLWELSSLSNELAISFSCMGFLSLLGGAAYFKKTNLGITQFLGILSFSYGSFATYKILHLVPDNVINLNFKVWIDALLAYGYFYLFHKFLAKTFPYALLRFLSFIGVILSSLNLIQEYINANMIISAISLAALWEIHKIQTNQNSFLRKVFTAKEDGSFDKTGLEVANGISLVFLLTNSFHILGLSNFPFYVLSSLFLGVLISLNTKFLAVKGGFWISLLMMFVSIFSVISLSTSVIVLICGVSCLALAYGLKKLKDNPTAFNVVKNNIPTFLKQYEVKDV